MNILLNEERVDFSSIDLPILISGAEKTGSSFFTVCLLANLVKSGHKAVFFSAHSAAKEEFKIQVGNDLVNALIIYSEKEEDFIEAIKAIPDLSERIVLIKNIDSYSQKLFDVIKDLKLVIFSGDLDKCVFAENLLKTSLVSKVFFSYSEKCPLEEAKSLPKYSAWIEGGHNGVIRLEA